MSFVGTYHFILWLLAMIGIGVGTGTVKFVVGVLGVLLLPGITAGARAARFGCFLCLVPPVSYLTFVAILWDEKTFAGIFMFLLIPLCLCPVIDAYHRGSVAPKPDPMAGTAEFPWAEFTRLRDDNIENTNSQVKGRVKQLREQVRRRRGRG
ncbi:hypothetical protein HYS54_04145 [Candidatus Micrarchaeota archaeon]|nr:hypothetical protein [Candidatus Micrarchaeota archaeon]